MTDINMGIFVDVMVQYPGTANVCLVEIALYRSLGVSTPELERAMISTWDERSKATLDRRDAHKTNYIIAALRNGRPDFSPNPFVHLDSESARAEQTRLANLEPGLPFAVYRRMSIYNARRPPQRNDHEDDTTV